MFAPEGDLMLGFLAARILNYTIMGSLMLAIVIKCRKNLWEQTLIG